MSEERLQEIKDSIEFQVLYTEKHNFDKTLLQEEVDLYNEVIKLNNIINGLEEYIKPYLYMLNGIQDRDVYEEQQLDDFTDIMEKLQELKGEDKE